MYVYALRSMLTSLCAYKELCMYKLRTWVFQVIFLNVDGVLYLSAYIHTYVHVL